MSFVKTLLLSAVVTSLGFLSPAHADLPKPTGGVILTIGGAVSESNRGPSDMFNDAFLSSHEYSFDKAATFDVAMLEGLGMVSATIKADPWPRAVTIEGPLLRDVLATAGWEGATINTLALDGFAVEISKADIEARDWILAIKADGEYLGVGGHGPAWLVYDVPGGRATAEDESRWPWAVFYIQAD